MQRLPAWQSEAVQSRRAIPWYAATLLGLLALTACGTASPDPAGPAPGSVVQQIQVPVPKQPLPLLTSSQARGLVPLPWSDPSIVDGGRQVVVDITAGCSQLEGVTVRQTSHRVTVTVLGTVPPGVPCMGPDITIIAKVQLPGPIASRTLSH
jgi:hypothetical protein